jgi:hypothetical protein
MKPATRLAARAALPCALIAVTRIAAAQGVGVPQSGSATPASYVTIGGFVRSAPYSAEGTTTVTQTLGDGTRIERTTATKVFRDSAGRERREQTIVGLDALGGSRQPGAIITIFDPEAGTTYTLDPNTHTARLTRIVTAGRVAGAPDSGGSRVMILRSPLRDASGVALAPPPPPPPPPPPSAPPSQPLPAPSSGRGAMTFALHALGARTFDGVSASGMLTTNTIAVGQIGNDRPIEITDEQWTSPDLKVVMMSKHHDPRSGDVEYRLTNVVRGEPPADLFVVPSDYTTVDEVSLPPPPPAPRRQE